MSSYDSHAESAGAYVVKENGQWVVYMSVVGKDISEHRIASYYSEKQARLAAHWIGKSANRKIPAPKVRIEKVTGKKKEPAFDSPPLNMTIAERPQPLGLQHGIAGGLLLPYGDVENAREIVGKLVSGQEVELPDQWRFYLQAGEGKIEESVFSLNSLTGLSLEADDRFILKYNLFVLKPDADLYAELRSETTDTSERALLDAAAYMHGICHTAASLLGVEAEGDVQAYLLSVRAHELLSEGDRKAGCSMLDKAAAVASPVFAARLHGELGGIYGASQEDGARAIEHLNLAIDILKPTVFDELRAELALELAMCCQAQASDDRSKLIAAINAYQQALLFYHREGPAPLNYGLAHMNLALAYLAMPMNDEAERLRPAIAVQSLREALKVFDKATHPQFWAAATLNLANALQHVPSTHNEANLWESVALYQDVLSVRTSDDPHAYARVLANLGNALAHLGAFSRAVPVLQDALSLFDLHDSDSALAVRELLCDIEKRRSGRGDL
ncbi:MAG TPA: hypothetical protein V6C97_02165 [Oculatellaceae cyanobacterium]